ncbi:uridylate kinase [Singulisphaera sp. PoT]|uniref:amino acid kinase family protein n=1 Tax=Singulisphaera sp. PoT TaxID=3411797 RepID=UPI003BF5DE62
MNRPVVIKVGGSLLDWPDLPDRFRAFLAQYAGRKPLTVVGGGRAADAVRVLDWAHHVGDDVAHRLALRALDLTAHLFAAIISHTRVIDRIEDLAPCWEDNLLPILAPRRFLEEVDVLDLSPLPASWDVTSDSIAARLADYLHASELVMLKSTPLPKGSDRHAAARLGVVDPHFCIEVGGLPRVTYLNLRDPLADPLSI